MCDTNEAQEVTTVTKVHEIREAVIELLRSDFLSIEVKESFYSMLNSCDDFIESRQRTIITKKEYSQE